METPSLTDLIEVMEKADVPLTKPKLKELTAKIDTILFDPISEVLTQQFGLEELDRGELACVDQPTGVRGGELTGPGHAQQRSADAGRTAPR